MIEGDKIVKEAIATQYPIKLIAATHTWLTANASLIPTNITVVETTEQEIARASHLQSPQPVIAVAQQRENTSGTDHGKKKWILALDGIQDPGNLGTIIRSADWFGIETIFCSPDCVDVFNPKVVQASMGSLFRIELVYTELVPVIRQLDHIRYAATLQGSSVYELAHPESGILLIGNESHGLRAELLALCDIEVTIPRRGSAESLNAAVACSIILSHLLTAPV